jgi:dCMP deaminase
VAIGDHGQVLSTGFNGWPREMCGEDKFRQEEVQPDHAVTSWFSMTIHAEDNLIFNANLNGVSLHRSTVYVFPVFPCVECAKHLAQVGIGQICYENCALQYGNADAKKWEDSWAAARHVFRECGVEVISV